jgi:hypothetical protein
MVKWHRKRKSLPFVGDCSWILLGKFWGIKPTQNYSTYGRNWVFTYQLYQSFISWRLKEVILFSCHFPRKGKNGLLPPGKSPQAEMSVQAARSALPENNVFRPRVWIRTASDSTFHLWGPFLLLSQTPPPLPLTALCSTLSIAQTVPYDDLTWFFSFTVMQKQHKIPECA